MAPNRIISALPAGFFLGAFALGQGGPPSPVPLDQPAPGFFWADFDGDGSEDAYVISPAGDGRLLRNGGDGALEDVTATAGVDGVTSPRFAAWCDQDADGDPDLYVAARFGSGHLFENLGRGAFVDVTSTAGLHHPGFTVHVAWIDYDRDGLFDLQLRTSDSLELYHNQGHGRFQRVSLGLPEAMAPGLPFLGAAALQPKDRAVSEALFGGLAIEDGLGPRETTPMRAVRSSLRRVLHPRIGSVGVSPSGTGLLGRFRPPGAPVIVIPEPGVHRTLQYLDAANLDGTSNSSLSDGDSVEIWRNVAPGAASLGAGADMDDPISTPPVYRAFPVPHVSRETRAANATMGIASPQTFPVPRTLAVVVREPVGVTTTENVVVSYGVPTPFVAFFDTGSVRGLRFQAFGTTIEFDENDRPGGYAGSFHLAVVHYTPAGVIVTVDGVVKSDPNPLAAAHDFAIFGGGTVFNTNNSDIALLRQWSGVIDYSAIEAWFLDKLGQPAFPF